MKLMRSLAPLAAVLLLTAGSCDEDDPSDEGNPLAGTYSVTGFTYTADANAAMTVNLATVPAGSGGPYGITSMTVAEDNSFAGVLKLPGVPTLNIEGVIETTGNNITINFDEATTGGAVTDESGTYTMSGSTLTITLPDVTFNYHLVNPAAPDADVESNLVIVGTRS
jgi:hypothetical protein